MKTTPVQLYGHHIYMQFEQCIVLDQIMRQKPSQIKFIECLNNIRLGDVTKSDWEKVNSRALSNLSIEERQVFDQNDAILFTETSGYSSSSNSSIG